MKIIKIACSAISLIFMLAIVNDVSANHNPTDWKAKIMTYLGDFEELKKSNLPDKILVDFILNEQGEIMILSTSHPEFDEWLKSRLNYKKVSIPQLNNIEKYTLPIVFDKD